jgi:acetyl esterase/lipase
VHASTTEASHRYTEVIALDAHTVKTQIRALGRAFSPEIVQATLKVYAPLATQMSAGKSSVRRDVLYGPHERHRLDIHLPEAEGDRPRPALIFLHGGGFIGGEKTRPNSPFYDNVGRWAVGNAMVGINMTYRLAPEYPWPAGAEDVAMAVRWIRENSNSLAIDPQGLFFMGQSAGAVHVASYVAHRQFHGPNGLRLAGAIMLSGLYDLERTARSPMHDAYFGEDTNRYGEMSSISGLSRTSLPLLFTVSEFDPPEFQQQASLLAASFIESCASLPRLLYLTDHNHLSSVLQLGTAYDKLGSEIKNFIDGVRDGSIRS